MHLITHAKIVQHLFLLSFFSNPSTIMTDVSKLLLAQTSYIVLVVVHLNLGLLENIVACEFHWHGRVLYIL